MRMNLFTVGVLTAVLTACAAPESETPTQALQAIIKLYEQRDFESLIRGRYAEIAKAQEEEQIIALIAKFSKYFDNDEMLEKATNTYLAAAQSVPEYDDDGNSVTFTLESGFIKLSKMPNGKWGFHL